MRSLSHILLPVLACALLGPAGHAQAQTKGPNGTFATNFEVVVDNCAGAGASLEKAPVTVNQAGPALTIKIPTLPDMKGKAGKRGKLRAVATSEAGESTLRTKYAFNGKVSPQGLKAVLVAEHFEGDKPKCTQSWSVMGSRAAR